MPINTVYVLPGPDQTWHVRRGGGTRSYLSFDLMDEAVCYAKDLSRNLNGALIVTEQHPDLSFEDACI